MIDWNIVSKKIKGLPLKKEEENQFKHWYIQDKAHRKFYQKAIKYYKKLKPIGSVSDSQLEASWKRLYDTISGAPVSRRIMLRPWMRYAAIFIVLLGIGYIYQSGVLTKPETLVISDEAITLQLENGEIEVISQNGTKQIMDIQGKVVGNQSGKQLIYNNEQEKETLEYNTLNVPYGKHFELKLSDGTHVYVNAGTSIKYPVKFIKGQNRQVLLNGEAYFEVAKDTAHPFIVEAENINVKVLGTHFNINAYSEDTETNVVLIEGSVEVSSLITHHSSLITPGEQASVDTTGHISTKTVDTNLYTAWIHGKMVFRYMTFDNILKKLERHYNVTIVNNNKELGKQPFAASFDTETIEQVLQSFNENYAIQYTIKDNKIIIN